MTEITHIQPTDRISQGPSQIKDIILKVITNCAGNVFPTQDNAVGRLAFITADGDPQYANWICAYRGLNPDLSPNWQKLLKIDSPPPTAADFAALAGAKQANITGAASTITANNLAADSVVVTNAAGKIIAVDIRAAELFALNDIRTDVTVQAQLNGKQPNIVASTADPVDTNYPENTVWLVYVP